MLSISYIAALSFSWFFFIRRQRPIDVYTLALMAATVWFFPLILGRDLRHNDLHGGVYVVGIVVTLVILVAADLGNRRAACPHSAFSDTPPLGGGKPTQALKLSAFEFNYGRVLLAVTVLLSLAVWTLTSGQLFFGDAVEAGVPAELMPIWRVAGSLLFLYGMATRQRVLAAAGALHVLQLFLAHDRTGLAMVGGALFLLYGARGATLNTLLRPRLVALFSLMAAGVLWGSTVFVALEGWGRSGASQAWKVMLGANYYEQLTTAEPFLNQLVLNGILDAGYSLSPTYLLGALLQWVPSVRLLGLQSNYFNSQFQPDLFPDATTWGMAYSYWGEGIATGGWVGFAMFVLLFAFGLRLVDHLVRSPSPIVMTAVIYAGAFLSVYIHRNSLLTLLSYQRQVAYVALSAGLLTLLVTSGRSARLKALGRRRQRLGGGASITVSKSGIG